jgi:hypothetical protein
MITNHLKISNEVHGAKSCLRSYHMLIKSVWFPNIMKLDGCLPSWQQPATGPCHKRHESDPRTQPHFFKINFNIALQLTIMSSLKVCQVSFVIISDQCKTGQLELRHEGLWLALWRIYSSKWYRLIYVTNTPKPKVSSKPRETKTQEFMTSPSNPKRILISTQYMNRNT